MTECGFTYEHYFDTINKYKGDLILRHDIDFSVVKAAQMARLEHANKVKSHYFVMAESEYYNVFADSNIELLKKIDGYGHKIGFHYVEEPTYRYKYQLEHKGIFTKEYTQHKPHMGKKGKGGYSPQGYKYLSDSGRNWREGCFCQHLDEPKLYVLTHPIWWNNDDFPRDEAILDHFIDVQYEQDNMIKKEIDYIENTYLKNL